MSASKSVGHSLLLLLLLLLHLLTVSGGTQYRVISPHQLDELLCQQGGVTTRDSQYILYTNITHLITRGRMCVVNIINSLQITASSSTNTATIQCTGESYPTSGFVFIGSSASLTIQRVTFINCGANLTLLDRKLLDVINSTISPVYFTQNHGAVLVIAQISNVSLDTVTISSYHGFAIVAINVPNGTFHSIEVTSSNNLVAEGLSIGCGLLFLFRNTSNNTSNTGTYNSISEYRLSLSKLSLFYNFESIFDLSCISDLYSSTVRTLGRSPVINAAGLTVLYTQSDVPAIVRVSKSKLHHNYGTLAGGMLIIHQNSLTHSQTIIEDQSNFWMNTNIAGHCSGGALVAVIYFDHSKLDSFFDHTFKPLLISDTIFDTNSKEGINHLGAVAITTVNVMSSPIRFWFLRVTFRTNFAGLEGSCLLVRTVPIMTNNVEIIFESMEIYNNSSPQDGTSLHTYYPMNTIQISDIKSITINGTLKSPGSFLYNYGSVFKVIRSGVILQGYLIFADNIGTIGGAFMLVGSSTVSLLQDLRAIFRSNEAQSLGGAIYATNGDSYTVSDCTFQIDEDFDNISIVFQNNTAVIAGNSVYSTSLYNCYMKGELLSYDQLQAIYDVIFNNSTNSVLSTNPVKIRGCNSASVQSVHGHPGETLGIPLVAVDAVGHHVLAIVTLSAALATYDGPKYIDWWFTDRELSQVLDSNSNCTIVHVTIHTRDPSTADIQGGNVGFLLFLLSNTDSVYRVNVYLHSCPIGFMLDIVHTGSCICSPVIAKLSNFSPKCDINSQSFMRTTPTSWMGLVQVGGGITLGVSSHCHSKYCNTDLLLNMVTVNTSGTFIQSSPSSPTEESLCLQHRNGTLCGACIEGYSAVFGSNECIQCSNLWILTLLVYAIAGPLLIIFLYLFKLTLTAGTLNGVIFYAQAVNVGVLDALGGTSGALSRVLVVFLSILNLGLGFPLCFFDGMTELWKSCMSLTFPLYLLAIVISLIILCRYSTRVSNRISGSSIQVLITVVHLSFSKLLSAIIVAFTPATVYTDNSTSTVWYWDGSVAYGSKGHLLLIVMTLAVVSSLLVPYLLLLLLPKVIRHCGKLNELTRPILEAIHAPYKEGYEFWFVGRLLMLIFMYLLYSVDPYASVVNITIALVLVFSSVGQAVFNPYKNKFINILDCWLLLNLVFLFAVLYNDRVNVGIYCEVAVLLYFFTFLCVIVYHFLMVMGRFHNLKERIKLVLYSANWPFHRRKTDEMEHSDTVHDPYYTQCNEYREPLITPTSSTLRYLN